MAIEQTPPELDLRDPAGAAANLTRFCGYAVGAA